MAQIQNLSVAPPSEGCLSIHKLDGCQVNCIIKVLCSLIQTQNFPCKQISVLCPDLIFTEKSINPLFKRHSLYCILESC